MIPDLAAALRPLQDAVRDAQAALDATNRDPDAHPLDSLPGAGAVIREQGRLIDRCIDLLDTVGQPVTDEVKLRIQGRLRALTNQDNHG